jgi:1-acyl-sn-glycerol-3-phosphate acyltransferase
VQSDTQEKIKQPGSIWFYRIARRICQFVFCTFSRYQIRGQENTVPPTEPSPEKPLIVVSNHLHTFDPPLILASLPYRMVVLAAEKYERRFLGLFLHGAGAIFVRRGEVDRAALRKALAVLRSGVVLGMAPEGTRSRTGGLIEGKKGAAFLAYHTNALLLPVGLWGVEKMWPALCQLKRAEVRVNIGAPFFLPPIEGKIDSESLQRATDLIMHRIAALLPQEYRGIYGLSDHA